MAGYKTRRECEKCGYHFFSSGNGPKRCPKCIDTASSKKPELGYQVKRVKLGLQELSKFVGPSNKRRLSQKQRLSLRHALFSGQHFDSPIVVNEKEGMYRILDGNHRIEELRVYLEKYPRRQIEILLIKYRNLDNAEEIRVFRTWNVGRAQSMDDFIQSIAKRTPFIQWLLKKSPIKVTIYKEKDSVSVRGVLSALISSSRRDVEGKTFHKQNFVEAISELNEQDFRFFCEWTRLYSQRFGQPGPKNRWYSQQLFFGCMFVAYVEKDLKELADSLKRNVEGDEEIMELTKFAGRAIKKKILAEIQSRLNIKTELILQ